MNDQEPVIYVRQEAPNLLGRSIVAGFGFGIGLTAAGLFTAILAAALAKLVLQSTFSVSL